MKKILAVSGGVDSVVLFDLFKNDNILVAHFDHGTRPSSKDDAKFVENLCAEHHVECLVHRSPLGEHVSEQDARTARYNYLKKVAADHHGTIYTAHHLDDLVESIAINLSRGTGWRGIAPMGDSQIVRPFIEKNWRKKDILRYAGERELSFRQDPTNVEDYYLRNRFRQQLIDLPPASFDQLVQLAQSQKQIKESIDQQLATILPSDHTYQRSWFSNLDDSLALEILRATLLKKNIKATRPQLQLFLEAIRTYAPGKAFNLPRAHLVKMHKTYFVL